MAGTFRCVVVVPTRKLFDQDVYYASVPSEDGMFGVLPGHELLVSLNGESGVVTLNLDEAGKEQEKFLLFNGSAQMYNGVLTVLGIFGKNVKTIDAAEIEERSRELKAQIAEMESLADDVQDKAEIEFEKRKLRWFEIQLDYARNAN